MANIITAGNSTNGGTQITTDTSGTLNIVTGSGSGANAITIDASQVVTIPGNLTVTGTLTASGGVSGGVTRATAVTSTSGTSIDFTSIPSGVKRITVILSGVSTNGTSNMQIQIGSGSVSTSGYLGSYVQLATGGNSVGAMTTGFMVSLVDATAAQVGHAVITNITGNVWVCSSMFGRTNQNVVMNSAGNISLGGVLDRVRITTVNGTDTFDAGTINIFYE